MKTRGFTMIELLVVMAILGILMAFGAANYMKSLSRGRDAKRIEDMKTIQKGFELYYAKNDTYDADCGVMFGDDDLFPSGVPAAPKGSSYGPFECADDGYTYCTLLENASTHGNARCTDVSDVSTCSFVGSNQTHYCVKNVQ